MPKRMQRASCIKQPYNTNACYKSESSIARGRPKGIPAWNKGLTKGDDSRIAQYAKTASSRYQSGELVLKGIASSEWRKSDEAKKAYANHGGYRENAGRSKKYKYVDSTGNPFVYNLHMSMN